MLARSAPRHRLPQRAGSSRAAPRCRRALRPLAMRAVLQRVKSASVEVDGAVVSSIGRGWLCLVGVTADDVDADAEYICKKILRTRGWADEDSGTPWAKDVAGIGGEVLLVSQFTLYGRLKKPRPDFSKAMPPDRAREVYAGLVERVRAAYAPDRVCDGVFGAMMDVALINDGPVTFVLDSGHQDRH
ncbi:dtd [Scenedesmus sp. PABB004]|nr:dtd [Scenedesmus sp. PABB004]